ncbi:uncharacterized protein LOC123307687 [Coccinella septempunctata]|uniref:uncharacterized protein LOC123307687 n=1 Tax=Coccinella septempunctata TaxID=41139 RepID=UPI001D06CE46|nr:uncharacterized protein LOC123307687 [Coccinella septempunctata]
MNLSLALLPCLFVSISGRNALTYILRHKPLKNYTVHLLPDSNSTWVEYTYYLTRNQALVKKDDFISKKKLLVGVNNKDNFDCNKSLDKKNRYGLGGFSMDVLESLADFLNISIEVYEVNSNSSKNSTDFDVTLCDQRKKEFEYFQVDIGRYSMLYKAKKLHFIRDIFILTFSGTLWLVFFVLLVVLALCLRISTLQYAKIDRNKEPWSWVEITLWAIAAACQQGSGYAPDGFASKLIFLIGYITAYLLYTGFTAAITSVLLQSETTPDLRSVSQYTTLVCLINYECISHIPFGKFKQTHYVPSMDVLLEYLNQEDTILMAPEVYFQYTRSRINLDDQSETTSISLSNYTFKLGFGINHQGVLKVPIKEGLFRLQEYGVLQNIFLRNLLQLPVGSTKTEYGYSSAALEHVKSAIYILFYGMCASVIFLAAESCYSLYKSKKRFISQIL